jgi:sialic acid synthase SpsE
MIKLANKPLGDGHPCFITFEAGPTHNGLESAKQLCSLAQKAGADAVKFQILDPDRLVSDRSQLFTYDVLLDRPSGRTETVAEPIYDILSRRALKRDEWRALKSHADALGILFFATAGFEDEISFLAELGCHSLKIASADVNHLPLIRFAARTGMCLQLDTGNSTLGEIERAVDIIRNEGNDRIIIHQCPTGYPARLESINLKMIRTLKHMFDVPVAYSDHTPGWEMDVAALALGANLIEKTITEDRTTRSVEHIMSLEPNEMQAFVRTIRDVEIAFGAPRRSMSAAEDQKRKANRRSVVLAGPGKAGQRLHDIPVEFARPGYGIAPDQYEQLAQACLRKDLPAGHRLAFSDLVLGPESAA